MPFLPTSDDARQAVSKLRDVLQFVRYSPREAVAVLLSLLSFTVWLWLYQTSNTPIPLIPIEVWGAARSVGLLISGSLGGVCLLWAVFKIWKQLVPPPTSAGTLPAALKGPTSFGPHDAALFGKLHRGHEIATLLSLVKDDQHGVIVVRGESGSGKTSLLRAGLYGRLAVDGMTPIYWEATPSDPLRSLLRVVNELGQADAKTWEELCLLGEKDKKRRVIILDQFEQLRPDNPAHKPVFSILKHVAVSSAPHYVTCVVAYRREFDSVWLDFELGELNENRPRVSTIKLFPKSKAKSIFASLAEAAGINIDQELVDDLLNGMAREGEEISPSDIGITLLTLNELANRKGVATLRKDDYVIAGGPTGLLVDYINTRLERYRKDDQTELVKALLALEDSDTHQRLAEGLTADQLADKTKLLPSLRLQGYLEDLSAADTRVLERIADYQDEGKGSPRYRLAHERLIPALRQLAGTVLAEADKVQLQFTRAFQAWKLNGEEAKYLLSGKLLRQVLEYRAQLYWQDDKKAKETFITKSEQKRSTGRWRVASLSMVLIVASYFAYHALDQDAYRTELRAEWGLPGELYDYQKQLDTLHISSSRMTNLRWLKGNVKNLYVDAPNLSSLDGIHNVPHITKLSVNTIDANGGVRHPLKLELGLLKDLRDISALTVEASIASLDPLSDLKSLTSVRLGRDISFVSLEPLKDVTGLTSLSIGGTLGTLEFLKDLKGLISLTLVLGDSVSLDPLKDLKELSSLSIKGRLSLDILKDLNKLTSLSINAEWIPTQPLPLEPLKGLKRLTSLSLRAVLDSLAPLKDVKRLTTLNLEEPLNPYPTRAQQRYLEGLKDLTGLTSLSIKCAVYPYSNCTASAIESLKDLKGLTSLSLDGHVPSLKALKDLTRLTSLAITDSVFRPTLLEPLKDLKRLTSLSMVIKPIASQESLSFEPLKAFKGLTSLSVNANLDSLEFLKDLKGLTSLSLVLYGSVSLEPLKDLKELTSLGLVLYSSISLEPLKDMKGLTSLSVASVGRNSLVSLEPLKDMKGLTSLSLEGASSGKMVNFKLPIAVTELSLLDLSLRHPGFYAL
jgi:hypothetical protein